LALHRGYGLVPDLRGRPPSSSIGNGPRLRTGAPLSSEDGTRTGRPGAFVAFAPEDVQRRHERVRRQRQREGRVPHRRDLGTSSSRSVASTPA